MKHSKLCYWLIITSKNEFHGFVSNPKTINYKHTSGINLASVCPRHTTTSLQPDVWLILLSKNSQKNHYISQKSLPIILGTYTHHLHHLNVALQTMHTYITHKSLQYPHHTGKNLAALCTTNLFQPRVRRRNNPSFWPRRIVTILLSSFFTWHFTLSFSLRYLFSNCEEQQHFPLCRCRYVRRVGERARHGIHTSLSARNTQTI